jgi:ABC-type Fe3+ transport system substrate-binding protein
MGREHDGITRQSATFGATSPCEDGESSVLYPNIQFSVKSASYRREKTGTIQGGFEMVTRRTFTHAMIGVVAALGFGGSVATPALADTYEMAKKEGQLTIYTEQTVETIQALIDGFNEKYPGIEVDFFRGDSTKVTQRFETESAADRHTADIVTSVDRLAENMSNKGLFEPYVSPEAANYPESMQFEDGRWSNFGLSLISYGYNTDKIKPEEAPKDWDDLLDPKWKGKLGIQDPLSGSGSKMWAVSMYKEMGEENWKEYMAKLTEQDLVYGDYLAIREQLAAGEIWIQVAAYPDYTEPLKVKGAPVDWAVPSYMFFVTTTVALSKNAPNPNAGKLFIDFMLSKEGQDILGENRLIPARPESRPGTFARINDSRLEHTAVDTLRAKEDFFADELQRIFGNR